MAVLQDAYCMVTMNTVFRFQRRVYLVEFYQSLGYWHQRADERHGNPHPR